MGIGPSLPEDSEGGYPRYLSEDDVVEVRFMLLARLPRKVVDIIIDEAEYWIRVCVGKRMESQKLKASEAKKDNATSCYILTQPMPTEKSDRNQDNAKRPRKIQQIIFTTTSHDQGYGGPRHELKERGDPYHGSFTWFEASIIRFPDSDTPLLRWTQEFKSSSPYFPPIDRKDEKFRLTDAVMVGPPPKRWFVHCNRTAEDIFTQRTTVWSADDEDSEGDYLLLGRQGRGREFLSLLQPGDRIALLIRAMFPSWVNYVREASVDLPTKTGCDREIENRVDLDQEQFDQCAEKPEATQQWRQSSVSNSRLNHILRPHIHGSPLLLSPLLYLLLKCDLDSICSAVRTLMSALDRGRKNLNKLAHADFALKVFRGTWSPRGGGGGVYYTACVESVLSGTVTTTTNSTRLSDPNPLNEPLPRLAYRMQSPNDVNIYNGKGQNINQGNLQNVNTGNGQFHAGDVNVTGDLVQMFNVAGSNAHKTLWDVVVDVGASHEAEQQSVRGSCLEGTREEALRMIHEWRTAKRRNVPICWLTGAAGVGKTAIAMTIAQVCEEGGLVSSFFFFRHDPKRNNPSALMLTIAHDLTAVSPTLRKLIDQRISEDSRILGARMENQFRELVLKPCREWRWRKRVRKIASHVSLAKKVPNLVIIDGLDECSDAQTQLRILATIADSFQHSPRCRLRFLICSRPESWIRHAFNEQPLRDITKLIVLDEAFSPASDIERYLIHEFRKIRRSSHCVHIQFPDPWPSKKDLACLVRRSDGQFVYVTTAVNFVKLPSFDPMDQLRIIIDIASDQTLPQSPYHELDCLYKVVLPSSAHDSKFHDILAAILVLPLHLNFRPSPEFLELLFDLAPGHVALTLRAMYSVLDVRGWKDEIHVYHTSFTEYLFDQTRSGVFYIDKSAQHYSLAHKWLQRISRSKIGGYSVDQLYDPATSSFFTEWVPFCISLPHPSPDLLEALRDLDISALFFFHLASKMKGVVWTFQDWDTVFGGVLVWLESSVTDIVVESDIIHRFRKKPEFFHLEIDSGTHAAHYQLHDPGRIEEQINTAVFNITWIRWFKNSCTRYNTPARLLSFEDRVLPFRVTACYCSQNDSSSNPEIHPGHRAYHAACLRTATVIIANLHEPEIACNPRGLLRALCIQVLDLLSSTPSQRHAFEPALFSRIRSLFRFIEWSCRILKVSPTVSDERRTEWLDWLATCPDHYAREIETLKAHITSVFPQAVETPE